MSQCKEFLNSLEKDITLHRENDEGGGAIAKKYLLIEQSINPEPIIILSPLHSKLFAGPIAVPNLEISKEIDLPGYVDESIDFNVELALEACQELLDTMPEIDILVLQ